MFEIFCLYGAYSAYSIKTGLSVSAFILFVSSVVASDTGSERAGRIFLLISAICLALAVFSPSEETYKAWLEVARRP